MKRLPRELDGLKNTRCRIPDILLHDPLTCSNQIMAIEAKRCRLASNGPVTYLEVKDDLTALTEYVQGLHFQLGVFIGVGIDAEVVSKAVKSLSACSSFGDAASKIFICLVPNEPSDDIDFTIMSKML